MTHDKTVLFVEDNPDDVDITLQAFEHEAFPYNVVVAGDGQEALDYLFGTGNYAGRDKSLTPVLVILDLRMPRVGGLEVLKAMRADQWLRYVVAVILTSSDEERDRIEAERLGANLFLKKPMSFEEMRAIVGKLKALLAP